MDQIQFMIRAYDSVQYEELENGYLYIVGAGGHAKVIIDLVQTSSEFNIRGFFDDHLAVGQKICNYSVLGPLSLLEKKRDHHYAILAIGNNDTRRRIYSEIAAWNQGDCEEPPSRFPTLIHRSAVVSRSSTIGKGTVVMAGAVVGPEAIIGDHCIVNTGATVDHECVLGDFSSVAPGVHLGGKVTLGENAFVGIGASVVHGVTIGADAVIGAGSVVTKDVPPAVVCYGVPARVIRERKRGDPYL